MHPFITSSSSASNHDHLLPSGSLSPMLACTRLPTPAPQEHRLSESASAGSTGSRRMLTVLTSAPTSAGSASLYAVNGDGALPSPLPSPRDGASSSSGSKTAAFFGSPFAVSAGSVPAPPPAPVRADSLSGASRKVDVAPSTRSATADFFASSGSAYQPTPPPSVRSAASSREGSPPPRLPPLARFFPSRYAAQERDLRDDHPLSAYLSAPGSERFR